MNILPVAISFPKETMSQNNALRVTLVVALLALSPSIVWVFNDQAVWPWDQAWYGQVSADLWTTLTWHPENWLGEMLHAQSPKAPGLAWLAQFFVPIGEIFGSIEIGFLILILSFQFLSLAMIGGVARAMAPGITWLPLMGIAAMASAPLFVAMSHQFMTEAFQCFSVTYFYWIAARSRQRPPFDTLAHLILASGLAIAAKTTSPLYCIFPAMLALVNLLHATFTNESKLRKSGLLNTAAIIAGCGAIVLLSISTWYFLNLHAVFDFVKVASSSDVALYYGSQDTLFHKLDFWIGRTSVSLSVQWISWMILIIVIAGVGVRIHRRENIADDARDRDFLALAALAEIVLVILTFSFQVNEETRYLLPLLPSIVILLLWSLAQPPLSSPTVRSLVFIALAMQWGFVHGLAHGLFPATSAVNQWVKAYNSDSQRRTEIITLAIMTSTSEDSHRYNICGMELPWLNANTLSFFAAQEGTRNGYRAQYTSLGYAETDFAKAWQRLTDLRIRYYISVEASQQPKPDFLNILSLPVLTKIGEDPNFKVLPFDSKHGIVLFKSQERYSIQKVYKHAPVLEPDTETKERFGMAHFVPMSNLASDGLLLHLFPAINLPTAITIEIDEFDLQKPTKQRLPTQAQIVYR